MPLSIPNRAAPSSSALRRSRDRFDSPLPTRGLELAPMICPGFSSGFIGPINRGVARSAELGSACRLSNTSRNYTGAASRRKASWEKERRSACCFPWPARPLAPLSHKRNTKAVAGALTHQRNLPSHGRHRRLAHYHTQPDEIAPPTGRDRTRNQGVL